MKTRRAEESPQKYAREPLATKLSWLSCAKRHENNDRTRHDTSLVLTEGTPSSSLPTQATKPAFFFLIRIRHEFLIRSAWCCVPFPRWHNGRIGIGDMNSTNAQYCIRLLLGKVFLEIRIFCGYYFTADWNSGCVCVCGQCVSRSVRTFAYWDFLRVVRFTNYSRPTTVSRHT